MKRTRILQFAAVLALAAGVAACSQKKSEDSKEESAVIKTEKFVYKDSIALAEGYGYHFYVDYDLEIPVAEEGNAAISKIRDSVMTHIFGSQEYVGLSPQAAVEKQMEAIAKDYRDTYLPLLDPADDTYRYSYNNSASAKAYATLNNGKVFSYSIESSSYSGGAHGMYGTRHYNYRMSDGKELTESDIFDEGYEEEVTEQLKKNIAAQFCEDGNPESLSEYGFFPLEIKPNGNFRLTDSSVVYTFTPYEIAAYAVGQVETEIKIASRF